MSASDKGALLQNLEIARAVLFQKIAVREAASALARDG
jgi:hypothetical protein